MTLTGPLRSNASLWHVHPDLDHPPRLRGRGRPRVYAARIGTPADLAATAPAISTRSPPPTWPASATPGRPAHHQFPTEPVRVERRVSCPGAVVVARQRIHVGMVHAGRTLTVEDANHTLRVYDGDELVCETPRTTTRAIARFKARKPEPPRRASTEGKAT